MYIAIEGVIGVGKTTLARLLHESFQSNLLMEVFEENPFLSQFYADRQRYAFQTQMFFLLSRYHQQRRSVPELTSGGKNLCSDYTFEKDALFARINIAGDELVMYNRIHEALAEKITNPDLIVYLRAETPILMQRIAQRDRSYERNMQYAYIDELNRAYDDFFLKGSRSAPVLTIEAGLMDFVRYEKDLRWIEKRIQEALLDAPYQPELPLSDSGENSQAANFQLKGHTPTL